MELFFHRGFTEAKNSMQLKSFVGKDSNIKATCMVTAASMARLLTCSRNSQYWCELTCAWLLARRPQWISWQKTWCHHCCFEINWTVFFRTWMTLHKHYGHVFTWEYLATIDFQSVQFFSSVKLTHI